MVLNNAGEMVQKAWNDLSIKFPGTIIDEFIIMPNHMHGIIFIVGAPLVGALSLTGRTGKKDRGKHVKDRGKHVKDRGKHVKDRAGTRFQPVNMQCMFMHITGRPFLVNCGS
jgi:REP element-mobilizing transposase RayT